MFGQRSVPDPEAACDSEALDWSRALHFPPAGSEGVGDGNPRHQQVSRKCVRQVLVRVERPRGFVLVLLMQFVERRPVAELVVAQLVGRIVDAPDEWAETEPDLGPWLTEIDSFHADVLKPNNDFRLV